MEDLEQLRAEARTHELRGQQAAALALYRRLVDEAPDEAGAGAWARAGELELQLGHRDEAARLLEEAAERYQRAGLRNLALAMVQRLLRVLPEHVEGLRRLGLLSTELGYARDARHGVVEYAQVLQRAGDVTGAAAALDAYLRRFPEDVAVGRRLAGLTVAEGAPPPPEQPDEHELEVGILPTLVEPQPDADGAAWNVDASPLQGLVPTSTGAADDERFEVPMLEGLESTHGGGEWDGAAAEGELEALPLLDTSGHPPDSPRGELEPQADDEPLPLLGLETPELRRVPEPDPVDSARARIARDPGDLGAHRLLVQRLDESDEALPGALDAARAAFAAAGRHSVAAELAERLHRLRPDDLAVAQRWVEHAFQAGDRIQMVAGYLALARRYEADLDLERATQSLERVLELDPGNDEARRALAVVAPPARAAQEYVDLGALIMDEGEDEPAPGPAAEPSPSDPGGLEEILALFPDRVAQSLDPKDASSHYDLGVAFKEMGLLDDAVAQLQRALRAGANPLATLEVLGECLVLRGDHRLAASMLERATSLRGAQQPDLIGVHYWLGRCQEALADSQRARAAYQRVVEVDPAFRDAAARLAALRAA